ncbi:unnamed protein product [Coccothraustes coccothraustes]
MALARQVLCLSAFLGLPLARAEPIRYSVAEEAESGSLVGELAEDAGLTPAQLSARRARLVSEDGRQHFRLERASGRLVVAGRLDREQLCAQSATCMLPFELLLSNPLQFFRVEVDLEDINDHSPVFPKESGLADAAAAGTLPRAYCYEISLTTGSGNSEFRFLKPILPSLPPQHCARGKAPAPHFAALRGESPATPAGDTDTDTDCRRGRAMALARQVLCLSAFLGLPLARAEPIRYSVAEEAESGSLVGELAEDAGLTPAQLSARRARLVSEDGRQHFRLERASGRLVVAGRLDREQLCAQSATCMLPFELLLSNPLQFFRVEVALDDINDHSPVFREDRVTFRIPEMTEPGSRFPLEGAQDLDFGSNTVQAYNIFPDHEYFSVSYGSRSEDDKYIELVLKKALDREEQAEMSFRLIAVDGGSPPRSGTTVVNIFVLDVNDNAPIFTEEVYNGKVQENLPEGSVVLTVLATDPDAGVNGDISYQLNEVVSQTESAFVIDPITGEIKLTKTLDFEAAEHHELRVRATDGGGLSAICKVLVEVVDVNDNAPEVVVSSFSSPLPENTVPGTVVALFTVRDRDSGANGKISCALEDQLFFSLRPAYKNYYELVTVSALDREETPQYVLRVTAADAGSPPLTTTQTFTVDISDVNDNAPVFNQSSYTMYVRENNVPTVFVGGVSAADADVGLNAKVTYSLAPEQGPERPWCSCISVNSENGHVFVLRPLDYEHLRQTEVTVSASDAGSPPLRANVSVRLVVLDENDNAPLVLYPAQESSPASSELVPVSAQAGYLVSKVVAVDADAGQNAWLSYELAKATEPGLFRVGLHSGEVRTARSPLARDAARHSLVVLVRDHGRPALSATATLSLLPPDSGALRGVPVSHFVGIDGVRAFLQSYSHDVSLTADSRKSQLRFSAASSCDTLPARPPPDEASGDLVPSQDQVTESGGQVAFQRVRYAIPEELGRGSLVGPLARDLGLSADELPARKLRIVTGDEKQYFTLEEDNASLRVNGRIDRESICGALSSCVLSFEAVVENPFDIFHVSVTIQDINDNAPQFDREFVTIEIIESTPPGTRFPLGSGRDPDIGLNSLQNYELTPNPLFSLLVKESPDGTKHAELVLEKVLDREKQRNHHLILTALVLRASDGGDPARTGTARIRVTVLDANDNAPVFSQAEYTVRVPEDVPVGSVLVTVTATDADEGLNGQVKYSFHKISDRASELFDLDSQKGEITVKNALDFEKISSHELEVQAQDGGELFDTAKIIITVTDINDNAPEISVRSALTAISEDSSTGTVVALLYVQDVDSGANGEVRCSIDKDVPFRLQSSHGSYYSVVTASELDREQVSEYNVTVRAADGGSPALQSSAVLALRVLDVNDNAPVFAQERYSARVAENNAAGALVLTVRATDADWGQNARVRYRLAEGRVRGAPLSSYVSVQAETGALYALRSLDYEQLRELQLWVRAEDGGAPALSSNVSVRLQIVDENDNAPQVLYPPPAAAVGSGSGAAWSGVELAPRRSEAGALVAKVVAVDADAGQNAWLSYELAKATEPGLFRVGLHSGEVRTARSPLARDAARHSLVVLVRDHGRPALSATATLSVLLAESVAELLAELGSAADEAAAPAEPAAGLTRWLVLAVAAVSCLFVAFLLLLLALRLRRWHRRQLLPPDSGALRGVPVSHFVGIDGVRAFLQSYSHDVSLTADSRKSQLRFSAASSCDTLPARPPPHEPAPLLGEEEPASGPPRRGPGGGRALLAALLLLLLLCVWGRAAAERVRYAIPEELGRGSLVGPLARDLGLSADELPARKLQVASGGKKQLKYFTVNEETGNLYVNERLDREEMCGKSATCSVIFEVLVHNPLNVFHVDVAIEDVNDNAPSFLRDKFQLEINELTSPGARFYLGMAEDPDVGSNSLQGYELEANKYFTVEVQESQDGRKSAELVLRHSLDRESEPSLRLVLTALDGGDPARTGTAQLWINVTDANDNPPVFAQDRYRVSLREDTPPGSIVLNVSASDADAGTNAHITYGFGEMPAKALQTFRVDAQRGTITLQDALDFEDTDAFSLAVEATDGGGLVAHCKVEVEVLDVNDNPPEITILSMSSPVPEDAPAGTVVALLNVNDLDSGENGQVRCSIDKHVPFRLEKSYEDYYRVVTASELDREQVSEYNVTVRAADGGSPALQSSAVLALRVLDVNDNAPVFAQERYSARVAENNAAGALVLTVRATDADWGQNARVRYRLAEGRVRGAPLSSYVSVQAETGALYALRSLDYEQLRELQLWVRAEDGGAPALSSNVSVRLQIVDENDNAPQVLYPPPAAAVGSGSGAAWSGVELAPRRSEAGALVAKVVAVDADAGQNAWLSYELAKATEPGLFRVGLHSGEVRTARSPLARDAARHSLVVLVRDHGRPALSATATLSVLLAESVAELLAELGSAADEAAAPAEPAAGLTRWLVLAVAAVSCLFVAFLLLLLALRLRRWHRRQLLPPDSGALRGVPVSHFVGIDGVRAFLQSYSHDVSLTADSRKSQLRFSAASSCDTLPARPPPHEPAPLLGEEDLAGARPRALLCAVLLVAWRAAWGQLRYSVPEEMPKGSFVGDVAKDLGLQLPAIRDHAVRVVSESTTHEEKQYFTVNAENGNLYVNERLDREEMCGESATCSVSFEVLVHNPLNVFHVDVAIEDVNDNSPVFSKATLDLEIGELIPPGARFPLEMARDADAGSNSLLTYQLSSNPSFSLVMKEGPDGSKQPELVLERALDREKQSTFELVLTAVDGGDPARSGNVQVRINVTDANDNPPVFGKSLYEARVAENLSVGSLVLRVQATDADTGSNGRVSYSFSNVPDTIRALFTVDSNSGEVRTVGPLDFEEKNKYIFGLEATDGGGLTTHCKAQIDITDENDNAPEITILSLSSPVPEDAPAGTVVAVLKVRDRDSGENGQVRCSLDGDVPFRLEKSFDEYYRVVTARALDREQVSEYNVTVRAADGGSPALQSSAVLALRVLDVNDNAPVFAQERYSARVAENNAAGALVLTVRATDADWGQNARVRYRLAEGRVRGAPLSSYVSVQAETGALYALRSLDYEQLRELQLWVRAEDGGAPALSSNVSVRLQIVDENDNAPQVLYPPPAAAVGSGSGAAWSGVELAPRRSEAGALVAKVVAVDADAGQNAWLSYELAKATEPGLFRVGLHSGEVRTARSPLARDAARHSLVVLVRDHGRPALSATATLSVLLAESVAELLAELGSAADEAAAPAEPAAGLTRWLVLAVAAVSCLFVAFLLLLLALRLRRWHRRQLLPPDSGALRGVPVSHFVGIDGVRAFLQSYSHDVSLTADSRKSQLRFSAASSCDTLPARPPPDEPAPLLGGGEDLAGALPSDPPPSSVKRGRLP